MTDLTLAGRAAAFQSVLASTRVTDADGRHLETEQALRQMLDALRTLRQRKACLYIVGNGGSAAVASHSVVDFLKLNGLRAISLTDAPVLTAMANDFSYADAFEQMLEVHAQPGDALIGVSSSGNSRNIINAAQKVKTTGGTVITCSGFTPDNALRTCGHFNVWVDSRDYGMVEAAHQFVIHNLIDRLSAEQPGPPPDAAPR